MLLRPIALALTALPAVAIGQARPDSTADSAAVRLKAISVSGARAAAVVGGASAVVVRTEALRTSPAPLLEQALREAPFVHVRQNTRGEMELSVRGSDARQAAVLMDGVPMSLGWDHRTDPSLVPVTGSSELTIVRGLGTLLNGPNTLGGTIEVSHRAAEANNAWLAAGVDETGATVSTLGVERRLGAMGGGALSVRAGGTHRARDGFTLPAGAADASSTDGLRTNSDLTHVDGFAALHWSGPAGRSLTVNATAFNAERGVPPEEHISGPRLWRYPYHTRAVLSASGGSGPFASPFGTASIDAGLGYNSGRVKILSYTDRTYQTINGEELGDERTLSGRVRLTHSLRTATLRAAVTTSDVSYRESLAGAGADYRQRLTSAGAEVDVPVRSSTTLGGGLVWDHSTTPETGGRTPGQPDSDALGWRVGGVHELGSSWRLHGSVSRRSRFPALRELYSGALNRFQANPGLKPETLLGVEAGFTMNRMLGMGSRAVAEATGFLHNLDDAVARITVPNTTPPPATLFRRINQDRIESRGLEVLGSLQFGPDRERAYTLTADATVQRIALHNVTLAGQPARHAENNPETRGSLEFGAPLPWGLRATASARYSGTQYCINADSGNEDTLSAQAESDVAVERSFPVALGAFRRLRAMVAVDNVANATVFDQCGLTQPGRTLRVMLTLR